MMEGSPLSAGGLSARATEKKEAPAGGMAGAKDGRLGGEGGPSVHSFAYAWEDQFNNWFVLSGSFLDRWWLRCRRASSFEERAHSPAGGKSNRIGKTRFSIGDRQGRKAEKIVGIHRSALVTEGLFKLLNGIC